MNTAGSIRVSGSVLIVVLLTVLSACQVGPVKADEAAPSLTTPWPEDIDLPPPGQAHIQIGGQTLVFDEVGSCGLLEGGLGFMGRIGRTDAQGRYQGLRLFRRLAGDGAARSGMASEEDLVQLIMRQPDNILASAYLNMVRERPGDDLTRIHGDSDQWPAVRVHPDGNAVWARGELSAEFGAGGKVPTGKFLAVMRCADRN